MSYLVLELSIQQGKEYILDIISQELADSGFESFEQNETTLKAFAAQSQYKEDEVAAILSKWQVKFTLPRLIPHENWNELWESNFKPVQIDQDIYIRASFHPAMEGFRHELIIDPKMAFGTGHHATTILMAREMLKIQMGCLKVLDMGCGSGILAILAEKLGAQTILAVDIDVISTESTLENSARNNCSRICVLTGDSNLLPHEKFDIILANINRNILARQLIEYAKRLEPKGLLLMSGFYEADLEILKKEAQLYNLSFQESFMLDSWVAARFSKK